MGLGVSLGIPFKGGGISWSNYWAARTITGVSIVVDSDTQFTVSWTNNGTADYTGHKLYTSTDNITYSLNKTVSSIGTSTTLTGLTAGTLYYVKVAPYNGTNIGTLSSSDSAITFGKEIGNIITDTFARAALGANWDESTPLSTVALDGSKLIWSHLVVNPPAYTEYVCWHNIMTLERWECEIIFKPSLKDSCSYGVGIRFESWDATNKYDMTIQLNTTDNGTYGGLIYILSNAEDALLYQTPTKVTVTAGHSYKFRVKREKNTFTVYGENLNDSSTCGGSYTLPISYPQTSFLPNIGKLGFQDIVGEHVMNYEVSSCIINSEAILNPKTSVLGDSISVGYYSGTITDRYFDKLFGTSNTIYNLMASCGDKIATLNARNYEILLYKPKYVLIMIGANDFATNHATWQTDYETFLDYLITNDIIPVVCKVTPQNLFDITWMNTILDTICAARSVKAVDTFTPLKAVADNTLNAAYDSGDGLHPNAAGHLLIANTISAAAPEIL